MTIEQLKFVNRGKGKKIYRSFFICGFQISMKAVTVQAENCTSARMKVKELYKNYYPFKEMKLGGNRYKFLLLRRGK